MRICFDLDETLCTGYPYEKARPLHEAIAVVNSLKEKGHTIIIYTARRMSKHKGNIGKVLEEVGKLTFEQLDNWGIVYDELYFGKPSADYYIDDKAINACFINELLDIVENENGCRPSINKRNCK